MNLSSFLQFLAPVVSISYKLSITWIAEIIRTHFGQVNMHFVAADRLRQEIERQHYGRIYKFLSKMRPMENIGGGMAALSKSAVGPI